MEAPEDQAEREREPRMEAKQGIEGNGEPQRKAHGDPFRREVRMEDLVLQFDPEPGLLELCNKRRWRRKSHEVSRGKMRKGTGPYPS